jgi:hypothetical protein
VFIVQSNRRNPSTGLLKWVHIELRSDIWKRPSGVSGSSKTKSSYEHEICVRRRCAASTRPDASPKHTLNSTQRPVQAIGGFVVGVPYAYEIQENDSDTPRVFSFP